MRYLFPTLAFLIGVGFIITAGVIKHKVNEGRGQIAHAQQNVDALKRLSNLSEYTAPVGGIVTDHAQRKIYEGEATVSSYHTLSNWFMTLGVLLVVFGALWFFCLWKNA